MTPWPRDLKDEIAELQDELEWIESCGEGSTFSADDIRRQIRGLELELQRIQKNNNDAASRPDEPNRDA